ncbi:VapE domain-containing protein [Halopseudomonas oceani]|uniref:VapE domain-containing protein n=1 Tax=Halopseudomonas oceani TaxID=1708783 RepID=UPI002AA6B90E|nr:VapE domain-containing protein [Halopseudomonas oceani]
MTEKREAPISAWARRYIDAFGLTLVSIDPGEKAPKGKGWNQPGGYLTDAAAAEAFWQRNPQNNLGVVLGPSRVCSLDADDVEWTRYALRELLGVDLDAMADSCPTVVGNPARFRVLFRVPDGLELDRHSLTWPHQDDPDGSIFKTYMAQAKAAKEAGDAAGEAQARAEADKVKRFTVFELRAGLVQDVLPPSIHPGTGKPYTWRTAPDADAGLPVLPQALLAVWLNWQAFKRDAVAACPWAPKPAAVVRHPARPAAPPSGGGDVIEQFNRAHDVESLLAAHGYERRGNKWLAPCSSSGLPGVAVTDGRVYSHHASDPLANEHMNDAFDVFRILQHDGDAKAATKAAAKILGLDSRPVRQGNPSVRDDAPPIGTVDESRSSRKAEPGVQVSSGDADTAIPPYDGLAAGGDPDAWQIQLRRTDGGVLLPELSNAYLILKHAPEWQGVLAYNEFADRIEKLRAPPVPDGSAGPWGDVDASKALVWLQLVWGLRLRSSSTADEAVRMVAWDNRYHPVREYLDALPVWDDVPRLPTFMRDVFGADDNAYTEHVGQGLLVSAVARIERPGCKVDEMVVLEGGQGLGKSTCVAELFGMEWYLETAEPPATKDFYVTMQGNWGVEIGEMQSFSKADINQVKMSITRRDDKYRAPYDRHASSHPRQCIFIGTTNADAYLLDPTGARRFLPVLCRKADVGYVRQWRDQLWAEALVLFQRGFRWWDYPKDLAQAEQDERYVEDAWEEAIVDYLEGRAPHVYYRAGQQGRINSVTVMELLQRALQMDMARMNKPEQRRVGDILRRLGWTKQKLQRVPGEGVRIRPYVRPESAQQNQEAA